MFCYISIDQLSICINFNVKSPNLHSVLHFYGSYVHINEKYMIKKEIENLQYLIELILNMVKILVNAYVSYYTR